MRADRLLSILLLLQTNRRLTARALAQRFEVSERTIHRDMEALSGSGVPVFAERGNGGGWALLEPYRTNLTGLSDVEAQALLLAQSKHILSDLGLRQAADSALIKLLATLPVMVRRNAELVRQRIHVDGAGWRQWEERVPALPALQTALWQDRQVHLVYKRSDETVVERLVDPLGLVVRGSVWYLVAAVEGEARTYRVARVQNARLADSPSVRASDFDLALYWEQSKAEFQASLPRYMATLRIDSEILPHARWAWRFARIERTDPPDAEGWQQIEVNFEVEEEACICVLAFGPQVEVLAPLALRAQVAARAQAVVERYHEVGRTQRVPASG
jgi:predicted DNA-binding transcriptional regulator YafY